MSSDPPRAGTRCPCCGAETDKTILVSVERGVISAGDRSVKIRHGLQTLIASMLVDALPYEVTRKAINEAYWGAGAEPPVEKPRLLVSVQLTAVRHAFAKLGYAVVNEFGVGWRLVPMAPSETPPDAG
jgi:hypothetical protein